MQARNRARTTEREVSARPAHAPPRYRSQTPRCWKHRDLWNPVAGGRRLHRRARTREARARRTRLPNPRRTGKADRGTMPSAAVQFSRYRPQGRTSSAGACQAGPAIQSDNKPRLTGYIPAGFEGASAPPAAAGRGSGLTGGGNGSGVGAADGRAGCSYMGQPPVAGRGAGRGWWLLGAARCRRLGRRPRPPPRDWPRLAGRAARNRSCRRRPPRSGW